MCLTEKCSRMWVEKNLNFMFPIWNGLKQGDVWGHCFSTLLLNRPLEGYWVIQDGLKLNGEHQILLHADDNILGGSTHTVKENAEALVVVSKETGLEVTADKTKYMVLSWDQNAGWSHSTKIDNSSFERVEEFRYLGTILTNQNYI